MLANKKQKESTKNYYEFIDYKQIGLRPNIIMKGCNGSVKHPFIDIQQSNQSLNSHCFIPNKSNRTKTKSLKKRMFTFRQGLSL